MGHEQERERDTLSMDTASSSSKRNVPLANSGGSDSKPQRSVVPRRRPKRGKWLKCFGTLLVISSLYVLANFTGFQESITIQNYGDTVGYPKTTTPENTKPSLDGNASTPTNRTKTADDISLDGQQHEASNESRSKQQPNEEGKLEKMLQESKPEGKSPSEITKDDAALEETLRDESKPQQNNGSTEAEGSSKPRTSNNTNTPTATKTEGTNTTTTVAASTTVAAAAAAPTTETVPLHTESSLVASEVSEIVHTPQHARIEVRLKPQRTCQNPHLMGRLSGWSLTTVEFQKSSHDDNVVVGTYPIEDLPISGTYFVEIVALLCQDYDESFLQSTAANLKTVCLVDTADSNHRLTRRANEETHTPPARITIDLETAPSSSPAAAATSTKPRGRWLHKVFSSNDTTVEELANPPPTKLSKPTAARNKRKKKKRGKALQFEPLYTRYQPANCTIKNRDAGVPGYAALCNPFTGVQPFRQYEFRWDLDEEQDHWNQPGLPIKSKPSNNQTKTHVCFLGKSHSEKLVHACERLKDATPHNLADHLRCSVAMRLYSNRWYELPWKWIKQQLVDPACTHAVVGLFQWPFSFHQEKWNVTEYSFARWKAEMHQVIETLAKVARDPREPLRRIILRSTHANGLKHQLTGCPPEDYRHPVNARAANGILQELADEFSDGTKPPIVSYASTSVVTDPVWDSAPDWSHYQEPVWDLEAKILLAEILNEGSDGSHELPSDVSTKP